MEDPRIRFDSRTAFSLALKHRVDAYFQATGRSRGGGARMMLKTAVIFAWLFAGYAGALALGGFLGGSGSWIAVIAFGLSCGLATAGLGMAVQHDGGHLAYSERRGINKAAASVLDLLGASSYVWRVKHGVIHHTYTNIEGVDDDLDAAPFARMAPSQKHHRAHRFQHLYMWPLYGFLTAKWFLFDDFSNLARGRIGTHRIRRPRGLDLGILVGGKIVHFAWALLIPILVLGLGKGLVFYAALSVACGVTLSVVFQLAHCVEEAEFASTSEAQAQTRDFAAHQLATTVDFARGNKLLSWYVGGLNFQAVHHLFPRVSHLHYPALAKIVEQTAAEFGVRYRATEKLRAALRSHYRWLRRMGSGEAVGLA
ncbi:Linoleoyl-CoA desaturase [Enhygromyxa salina]|uniref:Linoleoyl-CoA desaturase n=1 Tax=Enhygromyxa salina TaxID=215803 RepID=A0A0C2DEF1_9BACT|nr:acyl-CoA desaturase [Enhygromyxa salina]KIG18052.1 Linoleoyl-CoA desaturase [Enhygromyxa salina]